MKLSEIIVRHRRYQALTKDAEELRLEINNGLPQHAVYLFCVHFHWESPKITAFDKKLGTEDYAVFRIRNTCILLDDAGRYNESACSEMHDILTEWLAN